LSVAVAAIRSDAEAGLVKRAQRGDTEAFSNIFHVHKPRVYSLCLRMTNNVAEAEDLTQEAFLQVFRKLPTFRGDSALSTWMYRVAVNTVLMYFRKRGRPQVSLDEPSSQNVKARKREYGLDDQRLVTSVDRIALARAIKELPDGYRTIFLLHEVEGYEHREIARLLKCSVGNSKSQLHKARLKMREILSQLPQLNGVIAEPTAPPQPAAAMAVSAVAGPKLVWSRTKRTRKKAQPLKPVFVTPLAAPDTALNIAA
jgi:RNA polymerase sigma-70 factor, ECF subfamily